MYTTYSLDSVSSNMTFADGLAMSGFTSIITTFLATYSILCLLISIFMIVVMWKLFDKAGKPGWAAIVPVYNAVVLFQIAGISPWLLLLSLIPVIGWIAIGVIFIVTNFKIAKAFGKDIGYGFGLWLLSIIFFPILAFGSAKYVGFENDKSN